ncbi:hypothetical protein E4T66_17605 [Sinimarinibacterium sp. CAU 1509]|uniref:hypothetical protein n=1 Tax=Sinimarinibacterium sp. CAU 1509 TaxID=2562283 RepID=UPI0010AC670C|nr:hypothetical protein [Sinimarinibacterium sp. CAU 1509]TJY57224.1 hypothetical protein E4T66_17605 [Sinimarinibacterium sp. CAU 1509]
MNPKMQSFVETPRMETYEDVFDALYRDDPGKAAAMKLRSDLLMNVRASAPGAAPKGKRPSACR